MKALLVVPTRREARALHVAHKAFVCGTGEAAYESLRARLQESKPGLLLLAGFCGGLDPSLGAGAIILCRQVAQAGHEILEPDRLLIEEVRKSLNAEAFPFVLSRLLTVSTPAGTRSEKRGLWNEHGAGGVDMETYQVARAAREAGVRWLAVRSVIDPAGQSLPGALREWDGDDGPAFGRALRNPLAWPGMARLATQFPRASASLRRALPRIVRAANAAKTYETLDLMEVGKA